MSINAKHWPGEVLQRRGFVEHEIELGDEDLEEIIREYLERHADFDFDEVEVVNNRPMNIWLSAKCRNYVDPDAAAEQEAEASQLSGSRSKPRRPLARPVGPVLTGTRNPPAADLDWRLGG